MKGESIARVRRQKVVAANNWVAPPPPIRVLLSARAMNALLGEGITDVEKILELTLVQLHKIPNLGRTSVTEICLALAEHGLFLKKK